MEITRVEALSQRIVQSYAWGDAVWHVWGSQKTQQCGAKFHVNNHADQAVRSPLLLLHGGSGSWTHWLNNVERFAEHREVWALDIPGFGDSSLPTDITDADGLVPYIAEILKQTFHGTAVDVIGFSFGGMTAALWLAAYPQDAKNLILVGSPGLGIKSPHRVPLKGWRHLPTEDMQIEAHRHNLLGLMLHEERNLDELAMTVHRLNVARDRMPRRRLSGTPIVADALPHISCPVHVIYGEWDALYKGCMSEVEKIFKKVTPHLASWQLVSGSGHWVQFEAPEAFQLALKKTL